LAAQVNIVREYVAIWPKPNDSRKISVAQILEGTYASGNGQHFFKLFVCTYALLCSGRTKYSAFVSKLSKLSEEYLSPQKT
jgi:hypothetical protein